MKRNVFSVIVSIFLIISSLAALAAGAWGGVECYALFKMKKELSKSFEKLDTLNEGVNMLRDTESKYFDGVELCYEGDAKLLEGRNVIVNGRSELDRGKLEYENARKQYNDAKAQLEKGKAQYAEAQAQMEATRPQYEEGKSLLSKLEQLMPLLDTYVKFKTNVLDHIPGFPTLNAWYKAVVIPMIARLGLELPNDIELFAEYMNEQLANGNAMLKQYEEAEAQLNEAKAQIDNAEAQLKEAGAVLDNTEKEINSGYNQLDNAEAQLNTAVSQLEEGKATLAQFEDAVKQLEDGISTMMETEAITDRVGNIAVKSVAQRLPDDFDLYLHNEEGTLLAYPGGTPRLDFDKCLDVCNAYSDYIKDYEKDLGREAIIRAILDSVIVIAAVLAFIAAIKALRGKAGAVKLATVLLCILAAANIYGIITGYAHYAHPQDQEMFTGLISFFGLLLLTVVSSVFLFACSRGTKKAIQLTIDEALALKIEPVQKTLTEPEVAPQPEKIPEPEAVPVPEVKPEPEEAPIPEKPTASSADEAPALSTKAERRERVQKAMDDLTEAQESYEETLRKYNEIRMK